MCVVCGAVVDSEVDEPRIVTVICWYVCLCEYVGTCIEFGVCSVSSQIHISMYCTAVVNLVMLQ